MIFKDRTEAGTLLAEAVSKLNLENVAVLGLPRGGVKVAAEVARALGAPLDLAIARKIGHPANQEAAVGAVSEDGQTHLYERAEEIVDPKWLEGEIVRKADEARQRRFFYTAASDIPRLDGKTAVLVDDGIATGSTMFAAVKSAKARGAARVVVAVPVGPPQTLLKLQDVADEVVWVAAPENLYAVGAHYEDFRQVEDSEVVTLLAEFRGRT
jgi:predicted phosphoribosyltransferase